MYALYGACIFLLTGFYTRRYLYMVCGIICCVLSLRIFVSHTILRLTVFITTDVVSFFDYEVC